MWLAGQSLKNLFIWAVVWPLCETCVLSVWVIRRAPFISAKCIPSDCCLIWSLSHHQVTGLIVRLPATLYSLHRGGSHSEKHQHHSRAKLGPAAYWSITSLSVSYCSRCLHIVRSVTLNWKWRSVLTILGVHLQKCHQAYTRSSPHKDGQNDSAGMS